MGAESSLPAVRARLVRFSISFLRRCGIDRAISYTIIGRGWSVLAGPLTIALIGRFLHPQEQGFYYTFGSVIALNVFFELGLTYVILQFASHEKAQLEWTEQGTLEGCDLSLTRLASLLRMALKWYGTAALLVIVFVLPSGLAFFSRNSGSSAVDWRIPWIWLSAVSALDLFAAPLFAIIEGCGLVARIASMRVFQSVLANSGLWITLLCRGKLFAPAVFQTLTVGSGLLWLFLNYRNFFRNLLQLDLVGSTFNWTKEVWPFQWKIAVSWLSGYFLFQLFNPVLFATHGPVVAGQMGMSLSLCSALLNLSMAWMSTKASPFGVLVARRQWKTLDMTFFATLAQCVFVLIGAGILLLTGVLILNHHEHPFSQRLLKPLPFGIVLLCTLMNLILFCEAQYLRAHKSEPFLLLSITGAALTCALVYLLARPFGAMGVCIGYMACCCSTLTWGTIIFARKRREWHGGEECAR